ncbi:hypothetical protein J6590_098252 [Homalodisca vitripennis]|nr:hypothetical protein J6590_005590 [Homalodisca vitripennis]KAG8334049.1 hypothetical protein J6590_098252 [Homalodisca vitripennis]
MGAFFSTYKMENRRDSSETQSRQYCSTARFCPWLSSCRDVPTLNYLRTPRSRFVPIILIYDRPERSLGWVHRDLYLRVAGKASPHGTGDNLINVSRACACRYLSIAVVIGSVTTHVRGTRARHRHLNSTCGHLW